MHAFLLCGACLQLSVHQIAMEWALEQPRPTVPVCALWQKCDIHPGLLAALRIGLGHFAICILLKGRAVEQVQVYIRGATAVRRALKT